MCLQQLLDTLSQLGVFTTRLIKVAQKLLGRLPVTTASPPVGDELRRVHALAVKHDLSAYDAAYLDLSRTLSVNLATFDQRLAAAADNEGIAVWHG